MNYWTDDVNGVVIGPQLRPYQFFTLPKNDPYGPTFIAKNWFENDSEAIEWFKTNYADSYRAGAEMRCYDQD